ncbi:MAG: hypothetical protein H6577_04800 [Lewinellaceae bacterium]|nr:hypothetical protein [Saprospiraceae bacterium]MCB9337422.1 hypothetical protein [Lewinellaceae bacterium]
MKENKHWRWLLIIGIPILFALIIRGIYGLNGRVWEELFSVMSVTFLLLLPFAVGAITIYLSDIEKVKSKAYRFFMPWLPIFGFFILTLLLSIEGWACWVMILPVFLLAASIGGFIAGYYKLRNAKKNGKLYVSLLALLPLLISPIEQSIKTIPGTYKAYTFIDIKAAPQAIWSNVTRVATIQEKQDKGWLAKFLDFPRPIKAELDFEGVGASREAIFSKGLVFHELVREYQHQKKMVFTIKANPYEIPSTTMDEHIVVGGDFFDVLDGTYELEKLNENDYRLHLYSHFEMKTNFNFYASYWGKLIMQDIQNNILQVIKYRAEHY